jgi:hypothetical protein
VAESILIVEKYKFYGNWQESLLKRRLLWSLKNHIIYAINR